MAKDKKETKKLGLSGWIEIFVFVLTALDLTFLLLGIFNVVRPECLTRDTFSYIVAFVLLGVCLLLFIALMLTEKLGKFSLPGWLKCVLYVGFFVFSNIYYYFGFHSLLHLLLSAILRLKIRCQSMVMFSPRSPFTAPSIAASSCAMSHLFLAVIRLSSPVLAVSNVRSVLVPAGSTTTHWKPPSCTLQGA